MNRPTTLLHLEHVKIRSGGIRRPNARSTVVAMIAAVELRDADAAAAHTLEMSEQLIFWRINAFAEFFALALIGFFLGASCATGRLQLDCDLLLTHLLKTKGS
jgi:hypothetical protein